ncbi:hypothetical protein HYV84_00910 [Candidatus Woesearchaeota archaeon]|nr:hypothetical protein [Candidatus Woesearchaeota archaeon]
MYIFDVRCPHCKNHMKFSSQEMNIEKKRKSCVYCGKSFPIRQNISPTGPKQLNAEFSTFSVEPKH